MSYNAQLHRRPAFGFCCKCDIRFTEVGAAHEHGIRCCRRGSLHLEEITMWSGCEKRRRPRRRNGRTGRRLLRRRRRLLAAATTAPTASQSPSERKSKGKGSRRARARQPIYSRRAQRAAHNARFMRHVFLCFHVHCAFVLYRPAFRRSFLEKRGRRERQRIRRELGKREKERGNYWWTKEILFFDGNCRTKVKRLGVRTDEMGFDFWLFFSFFFFFLKM